MWTEIAGAGGFLGFLGIVLRFQNAQIKDRITRSEYEAGQNHMCQKLDDIKDSIEAMDQKREAAKDQFHTVQTDISQRLARIEGFLNNKK